MMYDCAALAALLHCAAPETNAHISRFSTDSRDCADACFVAIKGETFDGNSFAQSAFAGGAACAILDNKEIYDSLTAEGLCCICCPDSIEALGAIAADYRSRLSAKTIAITGSAGKTTTREMLRAVLSKHFKTHCAVKSFNNNIGLPLTILAAPADCEVLLLEVGTNHPGEIAPLAKIAAPDIAVITNVFSAHVGNFGSVEAIAKEKAQILAGLKNSGTLFAGEGAELQTALAAEPRARFFSLDTITANANALPHCAENDKQSRAGSPAEQDVPSGPSPFAQPQRATTSNRSPEKYSFDEFSCSMQIGAATITAPLPGLANLKNLLAACLVCIELGLTPAQIAQAAAEMESVEGRLRVERFGAGALIDDCYNCNPGSLANALSLLACVKTAGRRIAVLGDMKELGEFSEQCHREAGQKAAACCDILLALGEFAPASANACEEAGGKAQAFNDYQQLEQHLLENLRGNDTVLVKGSRSMRMERLLKPLADKMRDFNKSEVSV